MSALGDVAAALLPPEAGGPDPERVASVARRMIGRMPRASQVGLGAGLMTLEGLSLARTGRTLGAASPGQREALLKQVARLGGAPLVDSVKSIILLAHGADTFAAEIAAVGSRRQPSRPDPQMTIAPAAEWPHTSSCDAVVIGSGAGGAFAARALARAGLDTVIVEEGERWTVERDRDSHPLDRFAGIYRDGGTTMALGNPPIALPLGRAVGGTTVIDSGTCFRPPTAVATSWHREHGLVSPTSSCSGHGSPTSKRRSASPRRRWRCWAATANSRSRAPRRSTGRALRYDATRPAAAAPAVRDRLPQQRQGRRPPQRPAAGVRGGGTDRQRPAGAAVMSEGGRGRGVLAHRGDGSEVRITARLVIVAAGAIPTAPLLRRSGLGGHPRLGRNLSIHPATGITAGFEQEVVPWSGVMQSVGIEELHESEGVLIEATGSPPGMGAISAPGYGTHLLGRLDRAAGRAMIGAMIANSPPAASSAPAPRSSPTGWPKPTNAASPSRSRRWRG